ncbi:MAG: winged helix-turn-helix transcriptional regulator, partial [Gammaproteobacteria bacterium]
LGISRSGGARNPHVFQYTLRFLRSGGTRPPFARDGFFTNSQVEYELTADGRNLIPLINALGDWWEKLDQRRRMATG